MADIDLPAHDVHLEYPQSMQSFEQLILFFNFHGFLSCYLAVSIVACWNENKSVFEH
jgi:hypothetical protein